MRAACVRVVSSSHQPSAASAPPSPRSPAAPRPSSAAIVKGPPPHSAPPVRDERYGTREAIELKRPFGTPAPLFSPSSAPPDICFPLSLLARTPWPEPALTGLSTRVPPVNIRTREATAELFKSHTPVCPPASRSCTSRASLNYSPRRCRLLRASHCAEERAPAVARAGAGCCAPLTVRPGCWIPSRLRVPPAGQSQSRPCRGCRTARVLEDVRWAGVTRVGPACARASSPRA